MGKVLDLAHYALDAVAVATGNPELIPAIEGVNSGAHTYASGGHNFGSALKSAGLSAGGAYLGSQVGGAIGGPGGMLGDLGTVGSTVGPNISSMLGSNIASSSIGEALGGAAGEQFASQYAPPNKQSNAGNYPFSPQGVAQGNAPGSLNSMSSLTPQQQASSLATQGIYGGGNGPQEQGYFSNLVQNQLNPSKGQQNDLSSLSPIENSYLGNLGFGGYGNSGSSTNLLEALSKWNPSA